VYDELGRAIRAIASRFEAPPAAVPEAELPTAYEAAVVGVGVETRTFHDAAGRVVRVVDALGNEVRTAYDAIGRVVAVTDPTGNQVRTTYDAHSNAVRVDQIDLVQWVAECAFWDRLMRHLHGVCAWAPLRITNAALEGNNARVRGISQRAHGYRNPDNLMLVLYHASWR
jgi:YD repeat-containing protein